MASFTDKFIDIQALNNRLNGLLDENHPKLQNNTEIKVLKDCLNQYQPILNICKIISLCFDEQQTKNSRISWYDHDEWYEHLLQLETWFQEQIKAVVFLTQLRNQHYCFVCYSTTYLSNQELASKIYNYFPKSHSCYLSSIDENDQGEDDLRTHTEADATNTITSEFWAFPHRKNPKIIDFVI